jgi:hypothetical protein
LDGVRAGCRIAKNITRKLQKIDEFVNMFYTHFHLFSIFFKMV